MKKIFQFAMVAISTRQSRAHRITPAHPQHRPRAVPNIRQSFARLSAKRLKTAWQLRMFSALTAKKSPRLNCPELYKVIYAISTSICTLLRQVRADIGRNPDSLGINGNQSFHTKQRSDDGGKVDSVLIELR